MRIRAALFSTILVGALSSCAASGRMVRGVPFWGEGELPDAERVNVWPLFYQAQDLVVVLWPLFDRDDEGFALRPLVAREKSEWSVLYPLAGWDTETGSWWLLPAYSLQQNRGLLPLWNFGVWNHVALAWWVKDEEGELTGWGLFPLFGTDGTLHHVGPVWWESDGEGERGAFGLFPLAYFDEGEGYVMPAWWSTNEAGDLEQLGVAPLFYYRSDDGYQRLITPLGGRGWGDGDRRFVNVLGPVFHHSSDGERSYTALAWPIFVRETDGEETALRAFPLFSYAGSEDASSFSMAAGLIRRARNGEQRSLRFAPLFSHNRGMPASFLDSFTLYGYRASAPAEDALDGAAAPAVSLHVGTPLLFNYRRSGARTEWGSLLNILDYETEGDASRFSLLYYLYRHQREGEQVRRDFFPFFTWDSGPERSGFSFLWRLFRYERRGDRTRGHVLFIPWGDHSEPTPAPAQPPPVTARLDRVPARRSWACP